MGAAHTIAADTTFELDTGFSEVLELGREAFNPGFELAKVLYVSGVHLQVTIMDNGVEPVRVPSYRCFFCDGIGGPKNH